MGRRRYTPEQIITMLREAEVLQSQGFRSFFVKGKVLDCRPRILPWQKKSMENHNKNELQAALGNQAIILMSRGELDKAMELL